MNPKVYYSTVVESIDKLREKGYNLDFSMDQDGLVTGGHKFDVTQFDIDEIYRYDGMTDPGDEATVYGISTHEKLKGVLVTGSSISMDNMEEKLLKKLTYSATATIGTDTDCITKP